MDRSRRSQREPTDHTPGGCFECSTVQYQSRTAFLSPVFVALGSYFTLKLTEEEKAKIAAAAAKKAARKHKEAGGLNPLAVLFLLLAIAIGESHATAGCW